MVEELMRAGVAAGPVTTEPCVGGGPGEGTDGAEYVGRPCVDSVSCQPIGPNKSPVKVNAPVDRHGTSF